MSEVMFAYILLNVILGGAMGSFLNVVALRTVEGRSWWGRERSRCPACGHKLAPLDMVPILSWLFLKGKCRYCGQKISSRYFWAEITCAATGGLIAWRWNISPAAPCALIAAYGLALNAMTDLYSGYIYDLFALFLGLTGLAFRLFGGPSAIVNGLRGALLGFAVIAIIIIASRGGMGWGDANLMAGAGMALGWRMTAVALYLGFMMGGIVALILLILKKVARKDAVPLAPFLASGGIAALLLGPQILWIIGQTPGWPWR